MQLFIFRHAEKTNIGDNPELSPYGFEQAHEIKNKLVEKYLPTPNQIFCSPRIRTQQTMQKVAELVNLKPIVTDHLHERKGTEPWNNFVGRLQVLINQIEESQDRVVYICSHIDCVDTIVQMLCQKSLRWRSAHFVQLDFNNGVWSFIREGDFL